MCLAWIAAAPPVYAQAPLGVSQPEKAAPATTTQVYDSAFFSQYDLSNAEDMLRRLPGVAAVLDAGSTTQGRGLGAGTEQILIDGKRLASKSNTAAATLRRIPASSVERVELLRGGSDEVQAEGLVINVVLKQGAGGGGEGNYEIAYKISDRGWSEFDGLVSYTDTRGRLNYVLGYERQAWAPPGLTPSTGQATDFTIRFRDERYFFPNGALQELRPQKWKRLHQKDIFTASTAYDLGGDDAIRLNVLYQTNPIKMVDLTGFTRFSQAGAMTSKATDFHYNKSGKDTFELGGEVEKALGAGKLNLIVLHSRNQIDLLDYRVRTEATSPTAIELSRSGNQQSTGEDVVRATYAFPVARSQTLTLGAEGARNTLDQDIQVFFDLDRDGRLEQIPVPTGEAHVAERRAELSIEHNWKLGTKWSLDSALLFEISRITTHYPAIPIRTLKYFKPRIDLRYNPTARDRLRFKAEKVVSQLDFQNFVPAYNVVDSQIDLGNPQILPQINYNYDLSHDHQFPNDQGVTTARLFYRNLVGNPANVPTGTFNSAGLPLSWRGNLATAVAWGLELTSSLRLTPLGLPSATLNLRLQRQSYRVRDVFTLKRRKASIPLPLEYSIGFRHDVASWRMAYGADYLVGKADTYITDIRALEIYVRESRVMLFVERSLSDTYSVRFDAYGVNGAVEDHHRYLYSVSQLDGRLARTETYREVRDRRFVVRLRGKF